MSTSYEDGDGNDWSTNEGLTEWDIIENEDVACVDSLELDNGQLVVWTPPELPIHGKGQDGHPQTPAQAFAQLLGSFAACGSGLVTELLAIVNRGHGAKNKQGSNVNKSEQRPFNYSQLQQIDHTPPRIPPVCDAHRPHRSLLWHSDNEPEFGCNRSVPRAAPWSPSRSPWSEDKHSRLRRCPVRNLAGAESLFFWENKPEPEPIVSGVSCRLRYTAESNVSIGLGDGLDGLLNDRSANGYERLRAQVYERGLSEHARRVVWPYLLDPFLGTLGCPKAASVYRQRCSATYERLKQGWQRHLRDVIRSRGEMGLSSSVRTVVNMVRKDVLRTDRGHPFYKRVQGSCGSCEIDGACDSQPCDLCGLCVSGHSCAKVMAYSKTGNPVASKAGDGDPRGSCRQGARTEVGSREVVRGRETVEVGRYSEVLKRTQMENRSLEAEHVIESVCSSEENAGKSTVQRRFSERLRRRRCLNSAKIRTRSATLPKSGRASVVEVDGNHGDASLNERGETNENVLGLLNILVTYALAHPDVSYCQGMSDIASPLLVVLGNEAEAYAAFCALMRRLQRNFSTDRGMSDIASPLLAVLGNEAEAYAAFCALMRRLQRNFSTDGVSVSTKFQHLKMLLAFYDPDFADYLANNHADDLLFCYRWLLLELKREFAFEDAFRLYETMWSVIQVPKQQAPLQLFDVDIGSPDFFHPPVSPTDHPTSMLTTACFNDAVLNLHGDSNTTKRLVESSFDEIYRWLPGLPMIETDMPSELVYPDGPRSSGGETVASGVTPTWNGENGAGQVEQVPDDIDPGRDGRENLDVRVLGVRMLKGGSVSSKASDCSRSSKDSGISGCAAGREAGDHISSCSSTCSGSASRGTSSPIRSLQLSTVDQLSMLDTTRLFAAKISNSISKDSGISVISNNGGDRRRPHCTECDLLDNHAAEGELRPECGGKMNLGGSASEVIPKSSDTECEGVREGAGVREAMTLLDMTFAGVNNTGTRQDGIDLVSVTLEPAVGVKSSFVIGPGPVEVRVYEKGLVNCDLGNRSDGNDNDDCEKDVEWSDGSEVLCAEDAIEYWDRNDNRCESDGVSDSDEWTDCIEECGHRLRCLAMCHTGADAVKCSISSHDWSMGCRVSHDSVSRSDARPSSRDGLTFEQISDIVQWYRPVSRDHPAAGESVGPSRPSLTPESIGSPVVSERSLPHEDVARKHSAPPVMCNDAESHYTFSTVSESESDRRNSIATDLPEMSNKVESARNFEYDNGDTRSCEHAGVDVDADTSKCLPESQLGPHVCTSTVKALLTAVDNSTPGGEGIKCHGGHGITSASSSDLQFVNVEANAPDYLPPPSVLGDENPFLLFVCLALLLSHRDTIVNNRMEFHDIAAYFSSHNSRRSNCLTRVMGRAKILYGNYVDAFKAQGMS